ncbi:hypothetical protein ABIA48_000958 [Pseudomonas sp. S30_BP2TU TE3576]
MGLIRNRIATIASKLTPTVIFGCSQMLRTPANPVGASLLAMAECQSTSFLNVLASSRASSLPQ